MNRREELNAMTLVELTKVHNQHTGRTVKKLKIAKADAIDDIIRFETIAQAEKPKRPSARARLRALFPSVGERKRALEVFNELEEVCGAKRATIATMISDLKRADLAGKQGPLVLERDGEFLKRVA